MSLGWFDDLDEARDYFENERLETEAWDALFSSAGIAETKVLKNAYNRLYYDPRWDLPDYTEATAAELIKLKIANGEMAYYLALHLSDEDRRKGLQAQAVVEAGIVKEKYHDKMLMSLPVPPFVITLLDPFKIEDAHFGIVDIARDEEESVNTKVDKF